MTELYSVKPESINIPTAEVIINVGVRRRNRISLDNVDKRVLVIVLLPFEVVLFGNICALGSIRRSSTSDDNSF